MSLGLFRIPDPGVKKAPIPDPGSGSATLLLTNKKQGNLDATNIIKPIQNSH